MNKLINRSIIILIAGILVTLWVLANANGFLIPAFVYIVIGSVCILFYKSEIFNKVTGIDDNYIVDIGYGILFAVGFIVLTIISPSFGAIGIPTNLSVATDIGKWIIIVISASVFESFLFFEFGLNLFEEKLKVPLLFSSILVAVMFSLFHFFTYGESLALVSGSFFSAGVVGFGWCYLRNITKSILPLIISHSILNFWIMNQVIIG